MAGTPSRWDWWHRTDLRVALPSGEQGSCGPSAPQATRTPLSRLETSVVGSHSSACVSINHLCVRVVPSLMRAILEQRWIFSPLFSGSTEQAFPLELTVCGNTRLAGRFLTQQVEVKSKFCVEIKQSHE